jgi:hypothetical protein
MKTGFLLSCSLLLALTGCSKSTHTTAPTSAAVPTMRSYNGTASVGDFLTITLDASAHTMHYVNHTNGDSATVTYTVATDGEYALNDPTGNLVAAYEIPNFVMVIQAAKTGPAHDAPSLVMAAESAPISLSSIANHSFNYMQFRTTSGGLEIGSAVIDGTPNVFASSYWPRGVMMNQGSAFHANQVNNTPMQADSSGRYLLPPDGYGTFDTIFGTPSGIFAVDTQAGALVSFQKAAAKDFVPTNAGTYKTIFYQKVGANAGPNNTETGTGALGHGTVTVTSGGVVTISDNDSNVLATGTLTPVADAAYLVGTNLLNDPCNGLYTIRLVTANDQQDVFCTFLNGALLFSSFKTSLPVSSATTYDYFYGCALK